MDAKKAVLISFFLCSCLFSLRADYHYVPYMGGSDMTRMPTFLWYAGCAPTAGTMVMGYWDNYGGMGGGTYGKNTGYGKLIQYYMDGTAMLTLKGCHGDTFSWSYYAMDIPKAKTHYDLAYYMQTYASGITADNTIAMGMTTVAGIRGYTDSTSVNMSGTASNDWSWQNLTDSIDSGKPCIWYNYFSGMGHAVAAWGYNDDKYIMVYNTWDEMRHDFYYTYYNGMTGEASTNTGIVTFDPGTMSMDSDVELFVPNGGEAWLNNTPQVIHWQQYGDSIDAVNIFYSQDGGLNWTQIASTASAPGDNYFAWTPGGTVNSARMRVRVEGWSGGGSGRHYGDDGSRYNFYIGVNSPTVTPTVTVTYTYSVSPTVTRTFTDSPTFTATRTFTPTFTCTSTVTQTRTMTGTRTVTLTATDSFTFTVTLTFTGTRTATLTRTPTLTATETPTFTSTRTATLTGTPTLTATETPTFTNTRTATLTGTPTFTGTDTPTFTETRTFTFTRTETSSSTDTLTVTDTPTFTETVTFTFTRTETSSYTATVTATETNTFTATRTFTFTRTETMSCTATVTATETPTFTVTKTETGSWTSTVTATGTPTFTATRTFTVTKTETGSFTATVTATGTPTYTVTRTFTLTATGTPTTGDSPTQTDIVPADTRTFTPTFTATPQYSPTGTPTVTENNVFIINGALVYPVPVMAGQNTLYMRLDITRQPQSIEMKIYTASFRLIKAKTWPSASITGHYDVDLPVKELGDLARGTYYYILTAGDGSGRQAKSKVSEFIILR